MQNASNEGAEVRSVTDIDAEFAYGHKVVIGFAKCIVLVSATAILWLYAGDTDEVTRASNAIAIGVSAVLAYELMELGWTVLRPSTKSFAHAARVLEVMFVGMGAGFVYNASPSKAIAAFLVAVAILASVWFKPIRD